MTALLIALPVVVGAVAVLNLLLTVGVIRRLRQHTERLSNLSSLDGAGSAVMLEAGHRVGEFVASTADGELVSRDGLSGQTLLGVFSPGCPACEERIVDFLAVATDFPGGRAQVLAVVAGEPEEAAGYRDRLAPVARVVVETPTGGPMATAFKVSGFPAFGLLDAEGVVIASGFRLDEFPVASSAAG